MQPLLESHHKLVVRPQGFFSGLAMMRDLARGLADAGVIHRSEADGYVNAIPACAESDKL